jgi:DNA repair exonuclease SbcCD ATPase subunit
MWIQRQKLVNFCGHREKEVHFSPRMNLIVGPNGSGKSTLLNAMLYVLTGIDRTVGAKQDNISQLADADERSYLELDVVHGAQQYRLTRSLRPDSFRVTQDGKTLVTGTTACLNWLKEELRFHPKQLEDFVFVEQKKLDGFLQMPVTARAGEMAQLFGITLAKDVVAAITRKGNQLPLLPQPIDEAAIQADMARLTSMGATLTEQLALLPAREILEGLVDQCSADLAAINAQQSRRDQRVRHEAELAQLLQLISQQEAQIAEESGTLSGLQAFAVEFQTQYDQAQATVQAWSYYRAWEQTGRRAADEQRKLLQSYRQRERLPPKPADYIDPTDADFLALLQPWAGLKRQLESSIAALKKIKPGQPCPTCGQPAHAIDEQIHLLEQQLEQTLQQYQPLADRKAQSERYDALRAAARQSRRILQMRFQQYRDSFPKQEARTQPLLAEREAEQTIKDYTDAKQHAALSLGQITNWQTQLQERRQRQVRLCEELRLLADEDAKTLAIGQDAATLNQQLQVARQQLADVTQKQADLASLSRQLTTAQQSLTQAQQSNLQHARMLAANTKLHQLAKPFHPMEAPRLVVYSRVHAMLSRINELLAFFQADFRVSADENLSFTAHFLDGRINTVDRRLSVGQLASLALALRVALNSTFAADLGVLALDEPTSALDAQRMEGLPVVLEQLRQLSTQNSLQVFFITHDPRVSDAFDKVIQLDACQ